MFDPPSAAGCRGAGVRDSYRLKAYTNPFERTINLDQPTTSPPSLGAPKSPISQIGPKPHVYPKVAYGSNARRQIAAASRLLVQALGPWTGGDGPAACRPLPCSTTPPPPSDKPTSSSTPQPWRPASARTGRAPPAPIREVSTALGSVLGLSRRVRSPRTTRAREYLQHSVRRESSRSDGRRM